MVESLHFVLVFQQNFSFLPNFHKCFYNSLETRKKCFLFPSLNSLLITTKKINLLISITFKSKFPRVSLSCYSNTGFSSYWPINARVLKRLFYQWLYENWNYIRLKSSVVCTCMYFILRLVGNDEKVCSSWIVIIHILSFLYQPWSDPKKKLKTRRQWLPLNFRRFQTT